MFKEDFLKISNHTQLADFFGLTYSDLAKIIVTIQLDVKKELDTLL
jgi:hypothetical protein